MDFVALAQDCAPMVHHQTLASIVATESSYNPYAIGVVGGRLQRQPRNLQEAVATAKWLNAKGYNWSGGIAQVNKYNFPKYGLNIETVFDACRNMNAGGRILQDCYLRALKKAGGNEQAALRDSFSCYYSGNFITGHKHGYVRTVVSNANKPIRPVRYINVPVEVMPRSDSRYQRLIARKGGSELDDIAAQGTKTEMD